MKEMDKPTEDKLIVMIDQACQGVMTHIAKRIKDTARRAYYLGFMDGTQIERDRQEQEKSNESD